MRITVFEVYEVKGAFTPLQKRLEVEFQPSEGEKDFHLKMWRLNQKTNLRRIGKVLNLIATTQVSD